MSCEIKLPQGTIQLPAAAGEYLLVVAGGRPPATSWLQALPDGYKLYVADHGLDYCQAADLTVDALYGDKDSVNKQAWQQVQQKTQVVKTYPVAKDDTDLQLLLADLPQQSLVLATGVWGGRLDHLYANIFSLLAYKLAQKAQVILADDLEIMVLLETGEAVNFICNRGQMPLAVSLLPLAAENTVSIQGVQWPLEQASLSLRKPYAVSNKAVKKTVTARCHAGQVGFYLTFGEGQ